MLADYHESGQSCLENLKKKKNPQKKQQKKPHQVKYGPFTIWRVANICYIKQIALKTLLQREKKGKTAVVVINI